MDSKALDQLEEMSIVLSRCYNAISVAQSALSYHVDDMREVAADSLFFPVHALQEQQRVLDRIIDAELKEKEDLHRFAIAAAAAYGKYSAEDKKAEQETKGTQEERRGE